MGQHQPAWEWRWGGSWYWCGSLAGCGASAGSSRGGANRTASGSGSVLEPVREVTLSLELRGGWLQRSPHSRAAAGSWLELCYCPGALGLRGSSSRRLWAPEGALLESCQEHSLCSQSRAGSRPECSSVALGSGWGLIQTPGLVPKLVLELTGVRGLSRELMSELVLAVGLTLDQVIELATILGGTYSKPRGDPGFGSSSGARVTSSCRACAGKASSSRSGSGAGARSGADGGAGFRAGSPAGHGAARRQKVHQPRGHRLYVCVCACIEYTSLSPYHLAQGRT